MSAKKSVFRMFSVLLVLVVLLTGILPVQAESLASPLYASSVPSWKQANISGFGDKNNEGVMSLEVFNSQFYAGTANYIDGARIWRTSDGITWAAVTALGFNSIYASTNAVVFDMIEYKGQLYAGTGVWWDDGIPGQIWRSSNGTNWTLVEGGGFGSENNFGIANFAVFNNTLYASTFNTIDGLEIWRSDTGDSGDWESMATGGFGGGPNYFDCTGLTVFNGYLYAAVEASSSAAAQVWRTIDGVAWSQVNVDGFGDVDNDQTGGFAIFGGYLYVGTRNDTTGAQLYRSNNGTTWTQVTSNGFGDSNNYKIESLFAFDGVSLYAGTDNNVTGIEIWRTVDGATWSQINPDGFGDSNNIGTLWSSATVPFNNRFYIGTMNTANGGEIWTIDTTFVDVPFDHPLYKYIQALYDGGFTAGCSTSPLMFCPDTILDRAQSAVFMLRGQLGSGYTPPPAPWTNFVNESWVGFEWAQGWAEGMYIEGLTTGCQASPLKFCPANQLPRVEASIFGLKMKYGVAYVPPTATGTLFADFPSTDPSYWGIDWAEKAYVDGLLPACGTDPVSGKPMFCPGELVNRGWGAYLIVKAKGLPTP